MDNDLPNNFSCAYVVEFGTWTNPDDATFTEFYSNSVVHSNGETLKAVFNFNFGSNITESNFSSKLFKRNDATSVWTSGGDYKALNGLGKVYLSNQLDTAKLYSSAIQAATQNDMTAYSETDIGKIYKMTITGAGGGGWGTDIYTNDSYIPAMAVHAGVITIGQTKEVYIKVVEGKNNYPGSTRNGITTSEWGAWGLSYQFVNEPSSYKATISAGQAEFSYVNISNGTTTLYIDLTRFGNTQPSTISKVKILDVYDGPVTYQQTSAYWAHYIVPSSLPKVTDGTSAFAANIRNANYNNWAFTSNINFAQNGAYKQHKLEFQQYDSVQLKTLYNSIVTYTGTGATATVGHGLGVTPALIIVKCRNAGFATNWVVWSNQFASLTNNFLVLNDTSGTGTLSNYWGAAAPTSSVFGVANGAYDNNHSGLNLVAYCFAQVAGYSAFGSYTGNGSTDGPFVYTGFRPRWIMLKYPSSGNNWIIFDTSRNTYNQADLLLLPSSSAAESGAYGSYYVDFVSNGFKIRGNGLGFNGSGETIIYAVYAENPFKYANAR